MLHMWVTVHTRSLTTVVMFSLRNDPSLQTNVPAFPAHFLFHAGSWAPHCASQRQPGRVQGHWFCGTIHSFYARTARPLQNYLVYCMSFVSNCVNWVYLDSHIFTTGFAVTSQQMEIVCPRHGFYLTVLRGFSGALYSPPDLTPFTLDKHNTKEKLKFYVRGWVITCRKKDSNSAGSPTTHKSSSNENFLSKQGFKTNWTRSPSAPPLAHPSLSFPFSW